MVVVEENREESQMLKKRENDFLIFNIKSATVRITIYMLGGILCGFLSLPLAMGKVQKLLGPEGGQVGQSQGRSNIKKRQDPFSPIKKRRVIPSASRKAQSDLPLISPIPTVANPNWKLLGIIDGQFGRQAVLQLSPHERVFVRPGLEVARSGWIIKTIGKEEVLFEHSSTSILEKGLSSAKPFILSFATLEQSS